MAMLVYCILPLIRSIHPVNIFYIIQIKHAKTQGLKQMSIINTSFRVAAIENRFIQVHEHYESITKYHRTKSDRNGYFCLHCWGISILLPILLAALLCSGPFPFYYYFYIHTNIGQVFMLRLRFVPLHLSIVQTS